MKKGQLGGTWIIFAVTGVLFMIVGIIWLVSLLFLCEEETYIIEDIIQISQGGLGSPDRCVFMTDKGKMVFDRLNCYKQIGEEITQCK